MVFFFLIHFWRGGRWKGSARGGQGECEAGARGARGAEGERKVCGKGAEGDPTMSPTL